MKEDNARTEHDLDCKILLSIFRRLSIAEGYNRSGRYGLSPLKAYSLPEKTKLIQGTLVKQMEDVINYEMCSPLRLKFREEES